MCLSSIINVNKCITKGAIKVCLEMEKFESENQIFCMNKKYAFIIIWADKMVSKTQSRLHWILRTGDLLWLL